MKDLTILHLSDLHIDAKNDINNKDLRNSLIDDVDEKLKANSLSLNVVVVTGDVVNKGGTSESFDEAARFFDEIIKRLKIDRHCLYVVPGNHDIARNKVATQVISLFQNDQVNNEMWDYIPIRFKNFNLFLQRINSGYDVNRFGAYVKDYNSENETFRFILLNSAWSSLGDSDFGNIWISNEQLGYIEAEIAARPEADATFVLAHHPISWLNNSEQSYIYDYLCRRYKSFCFLHGHIHDGGIASIASPDNSLINLASGIGYQVERKHGENKESLNRYAIYKLSTETGQLDTWLRIYSKNAGFTADTGLYRAGKENGFVSINVKNFFKQNQHCEIASKGRINYKLDPVPRGDEWVGRENEIITIDINRYKVVAITGVGGQGKSFLAAEYLRKYARGKNSKYLSGIWVDCRELPNTLHNKIIQLLDVISEGKESATLYRDETLDQTVTRFKKALVKGDFLIVFDNIDAYVNQATEDVTDEFRPFFSSILDTEHGCKVILTCRPPISDHRSNFYNLQLNGLKEDEGIQFFTKRDIALIGDNNIEYCRHIIRLTNGHPWWMGLIAGQIISNHDTLKNLVSRFGNEYSTSDGRIKTYFSGIYNQLNTNEVVMLRHLVESHRPLTEIEICKAVNNLGPSKIAQTIRRLLKRGLLVPHEINQLGLATYQVHPLLRELVHQTYNVNSQKSYVRAVLSIFLPKEIIDTLFSNLTEFNSLNLSMPTINNVMDSIEICLNSRNYIQAYSILTKYYNEINEKGYHHQFVSLACRVLDVINWEEAKVIRIGKDIAFLCSVIKKLVLFGDNKSDIYLAKYESHSNRNTLEHLSYLSFQCYCSWVRGRYEESNVYIRDYDILHERLGKSWETNKISTTRLLVLRDAGHPQEALDGFHKILDEDKETYPTIGNIARCLQKLGKLDEAMHELIKCIKVLKDKSDYTAHTNQGYAYLWMSNVLFSQGKESEALAMYSLARETWQEYAPVLLDKLQEDSLIIEIKEEDLAMVRQSNKAVLNMLLAETC